MNLSNNTDQSEKLLVDGSAPLRAEDVLAMLDECGISYSNQTHKALWTVEDSKSVRAIDDMGHTKNLFLKDRKKVMWLVTLHEDRQVDLNALSDTLQAKRFSFATPERLMHYLGVIPGAVSPFALLNDTTRQVNFAIDSTLIAQPDIHVHPTDNTMTTTLQTTDLLDFLSRKGVTHRVLE
ncbi:MAG: YbaK/EbsC family protein [Pseudomonadota bacterium]